MIQICRSIRVLALLHACLCCFLAAAQSDRVLGRYTSRRWSDAQGLANGRIASLAQTPDGYLWLGTERGVLRFDGLSFRAVPLPGSATAPPIMDLTVDRDGTLWVRTENAHLLRRAGDFFVSLLSPEQGEGAVVAVAPAQKHGVVLAGLSHGVAFMEGDRLSNLHTPKLSPILSIAQTDDGQLWMGTREGGLYRREGATLVQVEGTPDKKVNCVLAAPGAGVWIGTDRGLAHWNGNRAESQPLPAAMASSQVLAMIQDRERNLWVGTSEGLFRYTKTGAQWVLHNGLAVTALLQDREGDIWFGDGHTLERLRDTPIVSFTDLLPAETVKPGAVYVDTQQRVWVAPLQGGLLWMKDGAVHRVSMAGLAHDVVYSIDGHGDDIWLGRQRGGLTVLHMSGPVPTAHTWTQKDGLAQNSLFAVRVDQDGSVWACTLTRGVNRLRDNHFEHYDAPILGSHTVTAVAQTTDGTLWFASTKGLVSLSHNGWRQREGPPEISTLLADKHNGLWVGTANGLQYLDAEGHLSDPLPGSLKLSVTGLALDPRNTLWISTTNGVLTAAADASAPTSRQEKAFRRYGPSDGLVNQTGVSRSRSMVSDGDGRVWFATDGGLAATTGLASDQDVPALPRVEDVRADDTPLSVIDEVVTVPAGTRRLTLGFAGLDLRAPEQVNLRYQLAGFDKDWSVPSPRREASYTNLPPRRYRFRLAAQNSAGIWNEREADLPLRVQPTLLQRWDFRIACALLFLGLGVWIYRARLHFLVSQAEMRAEERLAERNRIARELHDTLLQGFLSVLMHLHVTVEEVPGSLPARTGLTRVLGMMDRVIEEARLAVQGLRQPDERVPHLASLFREFAEESGSTSLPAVEVEVIGTERPLRPAVSVEVAKLGSEAIANALRHSQAHAISVRLRFSRSGLSLEVVDDGVGMPPELLAHGRTGHFGLAGMRERARNLGARLHLASSPGQGTRLDLYVPARMAYQTSVEQPMRAPASQGPESAGKDQVRADDEPRFIRR